MEEKLNMLHNLYMRGGKHTQYQLLCDDLKKFVNTVKVKRPRYEHERLRFILTNLNFSSQNIMDIGANTGFFSFELLKAGAKCALMFEGNQNHATFLKIAAEILGMSTRVTIKNKYLEFKMEEFSDPTDITLLLNILHHVGDDFGDSTSIHEARKKILYCINLLSNFTKYLVFQMGFYWKGNWQNNLFPQSGTRSEMIKFITKGTNEFWSVEKIGIPEEFKDNVVYKEPTNANINFHHPRDFLNRPIFILKSKII